MIDCSILFYEDFKPISSPHMSCHGSDVTTQCFYPSLFFSVRINTASSKSWTPPIPFLPNQNCFCILDLRLVWTCLGSWMQLKISKWYLAFFIAASLLTYATYFKVNEMVIQSETATQALWKAGMHGVVMQYVLPSGIVWNNAVSLTVSKQWVKAALYC